MEPVIALLAVGAVLLLLETVLPGFIAGTLGLICLIAGVALAFSRFGFRAGSWVLFTVGILLTIGTILWFRLLPDSRVAKLFVSHRTIQDTGVKRPELVNQTGVAQTVLRPSGTAVINGRRVDVVSESGLIEPGTPVKVVAVEGLRVVVRRVG